MFLHSEGGNGTRLVPCSSEDGEAVTAGHCGVLTADQGVPAGRVRALQGALFPQRLATLGAVRVASTIALCFSLGFSGL